jgi:hypothetical protein
MTARVFVSGAAAGAVAAGDVPDPDAVAHVDAARAEHARLIKRARMSKT